MVPVLQAVGIAGFVAALVFSLVPLVVVALVIYKLSQIAEYNRQMVQALGRVDARLEDIENREGREASLRSGERERRANREE